MRKKAVLALLVAAVARSAAVPPAGAVKYGIFDGDGLLLGTLLLSRQVLTFFAILL